MSPYRTHAELKLERRRLTDRRERSWQRRHRQILRRTRILHEAMAVPFLLMVGAMVAAGIYAPEVHWWHIVGAVALIGWLSWDDLRAQPNPRRRGNRAE